ncbi:hypothetical protein CEUSTIGMA_g5358.t1 [Chlamydomonas eustigma]|uniref:Uncharacterized protein n=1 Tax=Chlamydomonas eustigma TaxID=1157962 RepID=A0A250X4D3_9CHLO|nr:hypothetical protein CEUSTIGMA_g5358.t1 [Chlamydomonas eustigma]|eukprot:GAX77916.1 hypothetical protein CEUSTIGMA_g5358.t1 [Chlamydomonas eustigma]
MHITARKSVDIIIQSLKATPSSKPTSSTVVIIVTSSIIITTIAAAIIPILVILQAALQVHAFNLRFTNNSCVCSDSNNVPKDAHFYTVNAQDFCQSAFEKIEESYQESSLDGATAMIDPANRSFCWFAMS